MSQNSARIALGVAFLTCASCAAFFFLSSGGEKLSSASASTNPAGETLVAATGALIPDHSLGWEAPATEEDNLWTYDLFTPVEVKWNASGSTYEPKGVVVIPPPPFGLKLVGLGHPQYRYRLAALIEGKTTADAIIKFNDAESRDLLSAKIGQTVGPEGGKIVVLSFENKTVRSSTGVMSKETFVRVKDIALNRDIEVRRDPVEFTDTVVAKFAAGDAPEVVWKATATGAKFENEAGSYVIKGIDFDAQTVTVEKSWTETTPRIVVKTATETLPVVRPVPPAAKTSATNGGAAHK